MIRFTYANGREVEYDYDWTKLAPKLQLGGLRLFAPQPGVLIPLNSHTIALIENLSVNEEKDENDEKSEEVPERESEEREELEDPQEEKEEPEEKLSIEEKKEKILAEMKAKSDCKHENKTIYYQEIWTGPKNNRKVQKRYFPVCDFCGIRERYVKAADLSQEDKDNAKQWTK